MTEIERFFQFNLLTDLPFYFVYKFKQYSKCVSSKKIPHFYGQVKICLNLIL